MNKMIPVAAALVLAGCGIPGDTILTDLTAEDWDLICDRAVDEEDDRLVVCEDGTEVPIPAETVADCTNTATYYTASDCTATLDDWVDCEDEPDLTDAQICGTEEYTYSQVCLDVAACIGLA